MQPMSTGQSFAGKSLTIVFPVYNETVLLEHTFQSILSFLETVEIPTDVIFVNDGSPDKSEEMLQNLIASSGRSNLKLISYPKNRGKGYAVKTGVLAAQGEYILMSDTDLSSPLSEWVKLKKSIDSGASFACGSRAVLGADVGKPPPLHRRILSKIFNLLVCMAGVKGISDTQCGFKLFRKDAAHKVFSLLQTERFAFDVEMIAIARVMGYRVDEVPVHWDYSGHSTVRIFSSGSRMIADLLRLVIRRLSGKLIRK